MTGSLPPAPKPDEEPEQKPPESGPKPPGSGPKPPGLGHPAAALRYPSPPHQSALRRRWPGPSGVPSGRILATALAAAAVAATSIPNGPPGAGWLVAVLAGTAAVGTGAWSTGPAVSSGRRKAHWNRLAWAAATVALVGVGTVRAAGWLFVLCLLTAGVTASLALVDGRSLRGMLLSLVIPPVAAFRALPWAVAGLSDQPAPAPAAGGPGPGTGTGTGTGTGPGPGGAAPRPARPQFGRILLTAAVSALLLLVFGALFASADAAFANLLDDVLPDASVPGVVRWIFLFGVLGAALLGAAYLLARPPDVDGPGRGGTGPDGAGGPDRTRVRRWEWAVPVALLDVLFLAFVLVQAAVLFGGGEHVLRTTGLTYADHARGGFWQLLAVSALALLVLAGAVRWAPRAQPADRSLIRLILGLLALLSLVVVASALYRMNVYADAYGATRLRLLVAVCELWIGLLFGSVLVAGIRLRGAWLPRVAVASAVLALLGLAVLNPDRWIADTNVTRYEQTGRVDVDYLSGLSADAAPALDRLPAPLRDCALGIIADHLETDGISGGEPDWREANLGRSAARRLLADKPVTAPANPACWSAPHPR